jgi:hypothetical protein
MEHTLKCVLIQNVNIKYQVRILYGGHTCDNMTLDNSCLSIGPI